ncbi:MAG TPA: hemerythrin domain-containing protein [Thermopolyspora sp.]
MNRRHLMGVSTGVVGGLAVTALGEVAAADAALAGSRRPLDYSQDGSGDDTAPYTPPEDLMRDHGVLKRVLLIYREAVRRIETSAPVPKQELHAAADIIRHYVEGYHEMLEERYVFPKLRETMPKTIVTLYIQHGKGHVLTDRILEATTSARTAYSREERHRLARDLEMFVRMYEVHEAREDTIIFPAFRKITPAKAFIEQGSRFMDEGERRFARQGGFEGIVDMTADIEKRLGIYDLDKFTARVKDDRDERFGKHGERGEHDGRAEHDGGGRHDERVVDDRSGEGDERPGDRDRGRDRYVRERYVRERYIRDGGRVDDDEHVSDDA